MLFLIKFIKFKQRIKFKKFELHNYGSAMYCFYCVVSALIKYSFIHSFNSLAVVYLECRHVELSALAAARCRSSAAGARVT